MKRRPRIDIEADTQPGRWRVTCLKCCASVWAFSPEEAQRTADAHSCEPRKSR